MELYSRWEIILAWLPNSDGSAPNHPHPCIYLGKSPSRTGRIIVVGITSDLTSRVVGQSVDMPWAPGKHPITGLDRPSMAQTFWLPHIPLEAVRDPNIGFTPEAEQHTIAWYLNQRSASRKK